MLTSNLAVPPGLLVINFFQAILSRLSQPISPFQVAVEPYFYRLDFEPLAQQTIPHPTGVRLRQLDARPETSFRFVMRADSHLDRIPTPNIYVRALQNMAADNADFIVDLVPFDR